MKFLATPLGTTTAPVNASNTKEILTADCSSCLLSVDQTGTNCLNCNICGGIYQRQFTNIDVADTAFSSQLVGSVWTVVCIRP